MKDNMKGKHVKANCEGEGYDWHNSDMAKSMGMKPKMMDEMNEKELEKENFPSAMGYNVVDHSKERKTQKV